MTSKARMRLAMTAGKPDRTPVMCQLSVGHVYRNTRMDPVEFWFSPEGLPEGFIRMADRYHFDGILISAPGLDPAIRSSIVRVEKSGEGHLVTWKDGSQKYCSPNEVPTPLNAAADARRPDVDIRTIDPDKLTIKRSEKDVPPYFFTPLDYVRARRADTLSIHGEVGTGFERLLRWTVGSFENGLMALVDAPDRCKAILERYNADVIVWALAQCARGIDALKISSPMAGAGFISKKMYEEFVLPYEKALIDAVHARYDIPCYIHTCGAIGDRLDLLVATGTDGLECLDPPPLGTVDLAEAVDKIGGKVFIKGNLDSVHELAGHTREEVKEIARRRIEIGKRAKGYILSSACSVSPVAPPENIEVLYEAVET